jgi:hypothetical protein
MISAGPVISPPRWAISSTVAFHRARTHSPVRSWR